MEDYHFVEPEDRKSKPKLSFAEVGFFIKKFFPVLAISAILPVFLFFVYNPPDTNFSTQASVNPQLRVWFEPSSLVVGRGNTYEVDVYASIDGIDELVVTNVSFDLQTTSGLTSYQDRYEFDIPFSDEQILGTISINSTSLGEQTLSIDESTFDFEPRSSDTEIATGTLRVFVK